MFEDGHIIIVYIIYSNNNNNSPLAFLFRILTSWWPTYFCHGCITLDVNNSDVTSYRGSLRNPSVCYRTFKAQITRPTLRGFIGRCDEDVHLLHHLNSSELSVHDDVTPPDTRGGGSSSRNTHARPSPE